MKIGYLILAAALALPAFGQAPSATGSIQGIVFDVTGAVIPEVRVTAAQTATGLRRQTKTDEFGVFVFGALPAGSYSLLVEREGMAAVSVGEFVLSVGQTVVQQVSMRPGQVTERLEVKEQPEALQAAATTAGSALGYERIEETPAQNRNYLNFVLLAPSVAPSNGSNTRRSAASQRSAINDSGFSFGGMRGRNNSLSIDGVDNRDETTGASRVAVGIEMVAEFRVTGTSVNAELGGAAGGTVNVVTRPGTNLWHGDATWFFQNEGLNARNPEAPVAGRPPFRRYQPGASVNGPIQRDRTFFSTAFEQEWEDGAEFSETPAGALAEINRKLKQPEFANAAVAEVSRGLFPSSGAQTQFSFKASHQIGGKHILSGRYAFSRGRVTGDVQDVENFTDASVRGSSLTRDHSFAATWMDVIRPRLVSELRGQLARRNVNLDPNCRGAMIEIPGVVSFGQSYRLDGRRQEDHAELVESITIIAGRHQINLGAGIHHVRIDARLANRFGGAYIFPSLADFLAGRPDVFFQAFGRADTRYDTIPAGAWFNDRLQLAPGLTLEAGVRYDRQTMPAGFPVSNRNVSPRAGLAWRPGGSSQYVLRVGLGLFYDRYPLAFLNDATQKDGVLAFEQFVVGEQALRAFQLGRGGSLANPLPGVPPAYYRPDVTFPSTYGKKLAVGLERAFSRDTTLTIEYSWVQGIHLPRIRNASLTLPPVYQLEQNSRSNYQGVSVSLHRRLVRELSYLVAYNLGRADDDASDFDEHPLDPNNFRQDWARSRQHQTHRVAASALFELPVEELSQCPRWLKEPLERITLAPIFTYSSGRPVNALAATDTFRTGAYPISARPAGIGRNPSRSPATLGLDVRLMKTILVDEGRALLQFGVESFNLTNHTNPLRVSPYYGSPSYLGATEMLNARQVQLFVQFEY